MKKIVVSDSVVNAIRKDMTPFCRVTRTSVDSMLPLVLDEARYDEIFCKLREQVGDLQGKQILEVGSGYGMMVVHGHLNHRLDIRGLEPPKRDFEGRHEVARQLLADNGLDLSLIVCGVGEKIPFPDNSFDIVFSYQVLEHVHDPFEVLRESWRVLKPGGSIHCNAPNYRTFWEGHYNIPWIPGISKRLARLYIRLWGRDPSYVNHLNFLNQPQMQSWLTQICGFPVESDFGLANWLERMRSPSFSAYANPRLKKIVQIGRAFGLLSLLAHVGQRLKMQDTLIFTIEKP